MHVHLLDGTYELFRHFFAVPPRRDAAGREVGATIGAVGSALRMLEEGVTHLGVATDHVIESFRNEMWPGYKTGVGIEPALWSQFPLFEQCLDALGVIVWPMIELEADDALASAAHLAAADPAVERVVICTPDKDLAQCVVDDRIVQLDRRSGTVRDAAGVRDRFGVDPQSIPDYLALVGDSADGFPGLRGWGAKSTAIVLAHYSHLEAIPRDGKLGGLPVRGAAKLAATLSERWDEALLFRDLATLRADFAAFEAVDELRWTGPREGFKALCAELDAPELAARARAAAERR